ncbi:hypothetical protein Dimus_015545 [Dionaea muscipula]
MMGRACCCELGLKLASDLLHCGLLLCAGSSACAWATTSSFGLHAGSCCCDGHCNGLRDGLQLCFHAASLLGCTPWVLHAAGVVHHHHTFDFNSMQVAHDIIISLSSNIKCTARLEINDGPRMLLRIGPQAGLGSAALWVAIMRWFICMCMGRYKLFWTSRWQLLL